MPPVESLTGQLHVALHYRSEGGLCHVHTVDIHSSRLRLAAPFFADKPVTGVPKLVGMLFSLCGTAQTVASTRACAQALGQVPDAAAEQQYDRQVRIETLFEHLLGLSREWHGALACEPPAASELQTLFKFRRELLQSPNQAVMDDIQHWFETRLLGLPTQRWLDYCIRHDVKKLSIRGKIGNLMTRICANGWQDLGNTELHPLPDLDTGWWLATLASPDAAHFCAEPEVNGQACETSALTRQWDNPALQIWREYYGSGLLTRLMARVLDMLECWWELGKETPPNLPLSGEGKSGLPEGISLIQTARGLLVHRATQQSGLIQQYQIVAPTEWNFHPQGSLYHMLHGLTAGNETELRAKAQALITALDPCVAYQLEMTRA